MDIYCSREKSISNLAYEKEKAGNLSEALYNYKRALSINPEYGFANKRVGLLLSESQLSVIPAIHHLEIARKQEPLDLDISLKLMDLTLFILDFEKFSKIFKDTKPLLTPETSLELETIYSCLSVRKSSKKMAEKLDTLEISSQASLYYRSLSLCYEMAERRETAEAIVNRFKSGKNTQ
jgi:tetratricopeptide (TPR) repeat protein